MSDDLRPAAEDGPSNSLLTRTVSRPSQELHGAQAGKRGSRRTQHSGAVDRSPATPEADAVAAAELIFEDFVARQERGELTCWDDYARQFPQYSIQLESLRLADLIIGDSLVGPCKTGDGSGNTSWSKNLAAADRESSIARCS